MFLLTLLIRRSIIILPKYEFVGLGLMGKITIDVMIGVPGQDPLKVDKDFIISKDPDGDGIILKRIEERK